MKLNGSNINPNINDRSSKGVKLSPWGSIISVDVTEQDVSLGAAWELGTGASCCVRVVVNGAKSQKLRYPACQIWRRCN